MHVGLVTRQALWGYWSALSFGDFVLGPGREAQRPHSTGCRTHTNLGVPSASGRLAGNRQHCNRLSPRPGSSQNDSPPDGGSVLVRTECRDYRKDSSKGGGRIPPPLLRTAPVAIHIDQPHSGTARKAGYRSCPTATRPRISRGEVAKLGCGHSTLRSMVNRMGSVPEFETAAERV